MTTQNPSRQVIGKSGNLLAIISEISSFNSGVSFVTPNDLQQQVAVMNRLEGEVIAPHQHLPVPRSLRGTQEVLIVLSGQIEADLYDEDRTLVSREVISANQIITLVGGGHGFRIAKDSCFIEVKQGPYVPGKDKEIFSPESPVL